MPTCNATLCLLLAWVLAGSNSAWGTELTEYKLKAAFLFNFIAFSEWPAPAPPALNVCAYGHGGLDAELGALQGKQTDGRSISIRRPSSLAQLKSCQVIYVAPAEIDDLPSILESVDGLPILTVADSRGAAQQGININMNTVLNKVTFEVNLAAARHNGLTLSSKLLNLATQVYQ